MMVEEIFYDRIYLQLVTGSIGTDPTRFRTRKNFLATVASDTKKYFDGLTSSFTGEISVETMERGRVGVYKCNNESDLCIGYEPGFGLFVPPRWFTPWLSIDRVEAPLYHLSFIPTTQETATRVLEASLEHFFIVQPDWTDGTLAVAGIKGELKDVGLTVLAKYLAAGRDINAKCSHPINYPNGPLEATYVV